MPSRDESESDRTDIHLTVSDYLINDDTTILNSDSQPQVPQRLLLQLPGGSWKAQLKLENRNNRNYKNMYSTYLC